MAEELYEVHWEDATPLSTPKVRPGHVLYQIIGTHYIYGSDALLYIGRTLRGQARLEEHQKWGVEEADNVSVRLASVGRISDIDQWNARSRAPYSDPASEDIIGAIERLLTYVHQPSYNQQDKHRARVPRGENSAEVRIFNTGKFHRLLPEISSTRFRYV